MGTVVSLAVRLDVGWDEACARVEAVFCDLDETFSLYREDSELSRIARRELLLTAASTEVKDAYETAIAWRAVTLFGSHRALATSGFSERGGHLWLRDEPERHFDQVTVFAQEIILADVLSTAILAAPASELDELTDGHPVDVLAVFPDGGLVATPRLRVQLTR